MADVPVIPVEHIELVKAAEKKTLAYVYLCLDKPDMTWEQVILLQQFVLASYLSQLSRQAMAAASMDGI